MNSEQRCVMVAGGTGFIGSALCGRLLKEEKSVIVLTRSPRRSEGGRRFMTWAPDDYKTAADLISHEMENVSAVVNLAGEPVVSGRWTQSLKRRILNSRINSTRAIVFAIAKAARKPAVLINASAVGYYGARVDSPVAEASPAGTDFLGDVCRRWESEALKAQEWGVRVVRLRIGVVLGPGGALPKMMRPFRLGLGGPLGTGSQWMSWVHFEDLVGMIMWLLEAPGAAGAFNATAPHPVTNLELSKALARVMGRSCALKVPAFVLRLALGEMSAMLLDGQNVLPKAALDAGFKFRFPELEPALLDLLVP